MAELKAAPDIRLENLTVGYGDVAVVRDINVTLPGGRISLILGGSGCGKSTLLKHILRLHPPITGRIFIGDHDICGLSKRDFRCIKQGLGVLFQDGALLGSLTLGENVALPLREHTRLDDAAIERIVRFKLGLVGLEEFYAYYPNQLSGGMRKRGGLARAMVMDPAILFCDEPTSGLDPINSAELDQLLLGHQDIFNMTIVVVSHDLQSTWAIADYVVVLGQGRVLFQGDVEDLRATTDPYLRRFLDRKADGGEFRRAEGGELDRTLMKEDCSKYWSSLRK